MYQIDVAQADAAVLVMPNGKRLLIDSGRQRDGQRIKNATSAPESPTSMHSSCCATTRTRYGRIDGLVNLGRWPS
jgi:hypothetical protein